MSKMSSHGPFENLQHKLCAKEGPGVKLAIWLPTTKSQESTRPRCVQGQWDTSLESPQGKLQVFFRPRHNQRCEQRVMTLWSPGSLNRDNFGTPPWESRDKKAIRMCMWWSNAENIIWGKVVASLESRPWWVKWVRVAHGLSQHQEWFRRCINQLVGWFFMQDRVTK